MMLERRIKELAIAMEALSRIKDAPYSAYSRIERAIDELTSKLEEQAKPQQEPSKSTSNDDDIPF